MDPRTRAKRSGWRIWYLRVAALGAVTAVAVLIVLAGNGGLLAGPDDLTSSDPAPAGAGGTTITAATVTETITAPTVTATVTVTHAATAHATTVETETLAADAVTQAAAQVETSDMAVRVVDPAELPAQRNVPVAALRIDNGLSAESLSVLDSRTAEAWVAASGKGLSYAGMTTGVAIAFGAVLLIGALVVPIVSHRRTRR